MKTSHFKIAVLSFAIGAGCLSPIWADEFKGARDYNPHFGDNGWDGNIGLGAFYQHGNFYLGSEKDHNELTILSEASYVNDNFFFSAGEDEFIFGYTLARDENWVIDAVLGPKFAIDFDDEIYDQKIRHLEERDLDAQLGPRFTWYGDNNRVSFSITQDISDRHDGYSASATYLHEWQLQNWLLTGRAGVIFISDKMANHIVGVSAAEATASIAQYKADSSGHLLGLALKAEYPVSEHWIFETSATISEFSKEFDASPITSNDSVTTLVTGLKYQF